MFGPVLSFTVSAISKRCEHDVEPSSRCERLEGADNLNALPIDSNALVDLRPGPQLREDVLAAGDRLVEA
eukprot:8248283-Alexandrium_andersonii.AAC.1